MQITKVLVVDTQSSNALPETNWRMCPWNMVLYVPRNGDFFGCGQYSFGNEINAEGVLSGTGTPTRDVSSAISPH